MATTFQARFNWIRRMTAMERTLLFGGIVLLTLLIVVSILILFKPTLGENLNNQESVFWKGTNVQVFVASISGALLAITLVYQVILFRISRFQTIFNHQMELHLRLVDKMKYKQFEGNKALKTLADELENTMNKKKGNACHQDLKQVSGCLKRTMNQYDYMLTPYFRHITSVLAFLKYRSPHSESKVYPDYYLNIFSRCELRLYFFYAVWEQKQIDKRKIHAEGCTTKPRKSESNMRQLFKDIEFDRYFRVAFSKQDATWQKLYSDFVKP